MRRTLRKANVDMTLAMLSICRDWSTGGDLRAKKGGTFELSFGEGCSGDAAEEINLRRI